MVAVNSLALQRHELQVTVPSRAGDCEIRISPNIVLAELKPLQVASTVLLGPSLCSESNVVPSLLNELIE